MNETFFIALLRPLMLHADGLLEQRLHCGHRASLVIGKINLGPRSRVKRFLAKESNGRAASRHPRA
jgi:hypothetical protein